MSETALKLTEAEQRLAERLPDGEVAEALRTRGLPNRRVEQWKWSDLRAALREPREPSGPYNYTIDDVVPLFEELGGYELVIANGLTRSPASLPAEIRVQRGETMPELLPDMPVASLATAAPVTHVGFEGSVASPFVIRRRSQGEGAHADRVRIVVAPGAEVTLIETHRFRGSPFVNALTELTVGHGAKVTRIVFQRGVDKAVSINTSLVKVHEGAQFHQLTLTAGAAFARHETQVELAGRADIRLDALYRLRGQRHADITSHVTHGVEGAKTRQLVKGIVEDRARGVFQGKFLVERKGQQTDAQMAHHALVLSGEATVNAKPELEIYADDVECAHGNTVGALDPEAMFYLRQRGLDEDQARRILIDAFAGEVFDRIEDERLRAALIENFADGEFRR